MKKDTSSKEKTAAGPRKVRDTSVKARPQRPVDQTNSTNTFEERLTGNLAKTLATFTNKVVSVLESAALWYENNRTTLETIHGILVFYEDELKRFCKDESRSLRRT
jgi:hypothetical protein